MSTITRQDAFELYPDEHCLKAPELLRAANVSDDIIHAVCSHGYGITVRNGTKIFKKEI